MCLRSVAYWCMLLHVFDELFVVLTWFRMHVHVIACFHTLWLPVACMHLHVFCALMHVVLHVVACAFACVRICLHVVAWCCMLFGCVGMVMNVVA